MKLKMKWGESFTLANGTTMRRGAVYGDSFREIAYSFIEKCDEGWRRAYDNDAQPFESWEDAAAEEEAFVLNKAFAVVEALTKPDAS